MIVLWIVLGLLGLFFVAGFVAFCIAFVRRNVPEPTSKKGKKRRFWKAYGEQIEKGAAWLEQQQIKHLQVVSYDGKLLHGRFVPRENAKGTIIFFHGYRSHFQVDFSASMEFYHAQGYNALYCDQRAHGKSQGKVICFGVKERFDVMSWVTYMGMELGEEHPIFISGLSMGAATVLMAADMEFPANVRGIIADCGFTSPGDQLRYLIKTEFHLPAKATTKLLSMYTRLFAGFSVDQWSTEQALAEAKYPVLLVHGLADRLVPSFMSQKAFDACTGKKRLELFPEAVHGVSYLVDKERYQKALLEFLEENL